MVEKQQIKKFSKMVLLGEIFAGNIEDFIH